jgi:hypothetical protein
MNSLKKQRINSLENEKLAESNTASHRDMPSRIPSLRLAEGEW